MALQASTTVRLTPKKSRRKKNRIQLHLLNHIFLCQTARLWSVGSNSHDLDVRSIFRGQFVAFRRPRLASADQPTIVIGGENKLIVSVLNLVQIERYLVSNGLRVAAVRLARQ